MLMAFGSFAPHRTVACVPLGFTLHTITGFHWPSVHHYYGIICHLTLTLFLNYFLIKASRKKNFWIQCQASPVITPAPCKVFHPQALYMADRVLGFTLFCTLTPMYSRIRFTFVVYTLLPMASFRPCRWPAPPLPFGLFSPRSG